MDATEVLHAGLSRLVAGDPAARDLVLELFSGRLRELAHRMLKGFPGVRRHDDTDDVFQGAALRLHRALGDLADRGESPRSLTALAATQIHRELVDLARRNARPSSYAANHDTNAVRVDGGHRHHVDAIVAEGASLERWEQFHAAIDALPPDQKEVFQMVWYLGADQKTIATLLGCSERSVKTYWRAAREAIKAALGSERPE